LTGTPVQNNLNEFYSILDLVKDNIFGTEKNFKEQYAQPIKKGL
jgi:SNF2 family DNA or RNA helicase